MTVQLGEEPARELDELPHTHRGGSAAVQGAIHQEWTQLQDEKLEAGYAAAAAENPPNPHESAKEAAALRARRRDRAARDDLA